MGAVRGRPVILGMAGLSARRPVHVLSAEEIEQALASHRLLSGDRIPLTASCEFLIGRSDRARLFTARSARDQDGSRRSLDIGRKTASTRARTGRFRSVIDPMRVTAYREGLLCRPPIPLPLILVRRPALLELLLQRTERLISRTANGAHQSDAVLEKRVEILPHEPLL
jgi:hypothetical protein